MSHLEELFVFCGVGVVVRGGGDVLLAVVVVIVVAEAAQRVAVRVAECGGAGGVHATCNGVRGCKILNDVAETPLQNDKAIHQ